MTSKKKKIEENREALETVANADCSASWIAQELLRSIEGDTSCSTPEPKEPDTEPSIDSQEPTDTEPEGSIFAY
ncbi:hypothetical protein [Halolamina sp. C58]|uniref:hypothetical protein n=1 Tax=Halolamina sp. C58 TaxID=3421640 RepID=UPI003EB9C84B